MGVLKMADLQVTIGFNTKPWSSMTGWLGVPRQNGSLQIPRVSRPRSATSFGMIIWQSAFLNMFISMLKVNYRTLFGPWSKAMSHYQMASVIVKTGCWAQTIGTVRRCFKRRNFSGRWCFISSYGSDVRSFSYSKSRELFFGLGVNRWLIAANSDPPCIFVGFCLKKDFLVRCH